MSSRNLLRGLGLLVGCLVAASMLGSQPLALRLDLEGAIGPVTADYVRRGLDTADQRDARVVVLQLDTPGGLDTAMREIVQTILAAPVPVVAYVAPGGARAASAGTYILYASHVAAAAPATNLGAATPVRIGGLPTSPKPATEPAEGADAPAERSDAMQRKSINDAAAYLRGLAELRGRNVEWAEQAVLEGASLSASAALEAGVIDLLASDVRDLLRQVDGRRVVVKGMEVELDTQDLVLEDYARDWRNELLSIITNPNLAYMLLMIGIYGLIIEFYNPGYYLPGVAGAICLLLALFSFQILPINYAGLALLLLGVAFMVAEAFVPSFGALGLGGLAAFIFGSMTLVDAQGQAISLPLIIGTALLSAGFSIWVLARLARLRKQPVVSGSEQLIGSRGVALMDFKDGKGRVRVHGESWSGQGRGIRKDQAVRVVGIRGLVLDVEPETGERT